MELVAPKYYEKFKCIADRCTHSCCIGWEIDVDTDTLARHKASSHALSKELLGAIPEGESYIALSDGGRCPFLDGCGLCRIISELGESAVSVICREHPRFYHRIADRVEVGVGASCEEAARLILTEQMLPLIRIERRAHDVEDGGDEMILCERDSMLDTVAAAPSVSSALEILSQRYCIDEGIFSSDGIGDALASLELLDENDREIISKVMGKYQKCKSKYAKGLLSYFIYRHVSLAHNYPSLRCALALSILLTLIFSANEVDDLHSAVHIARVISEEIEYSEDNTDALKLELFCLL